MTLLYLRNVINPNLRNKKKYILNSNLTLRFKSVMCHYKLTANRKLTINNKNFNFKLKLSYLTSFKNINLNNNSKISYEKMKITVVQ